LGYTNILVGLSLWKTGIPQWDVSHKPLVCWDELANIYLTHRIFVLTISYMKEPKTLQEAIVYFSDADRVFNFAVKLIWPDGKATCPRCGSKENRFVSTRRIWFCKACEKQFSVKVGTIFEDSPIGLDKWMAAFWMLVNCKNGVSSMEIHRALGVTQKTAWFMLQRLRLALQSGDMGKLGGHVEVDETFIGGKARNMHKDRRAKFGLKAMENKTIVAGVLQRDGKVRTEVIRDRERKTLHALVREYVEPGTTLSTDDCKGYWGLYKDYVHQIVDHAETYVSGQVHTNGIENFWSLVKRGLHGTYVSVEPFHLFRYLDEQIFRFENRATKKHFVSDSDRFQLAMSQVSGKRLTYQGLIGKELLEKPRPEAF
jgi:transposase-like protein